MSKRATTSKSIMITWSPVKVTKSIEYDEGGFYPDSHDRMRRVVLKEISYKYELTVTTCKYENGAPKGIPSHKTYKFDLGNRAIEPTTLTLAKLRELSDNYYSVYQWTDRVMFDATVTPFNNGVPQPTWHYDSRLDY